MKIGVLSNDESGRMLALAGMRLGIEFEFANDIKGIKTLINTVDLAIIQPAVFADTEFSKLRKVLPVFPDSRTTALTQDRDLLREFLSDLGIPISHDYSADDAILRELSIIAVRNRNSEIRYYPIAENNYQHGLLLKSQSRPGDPLQALAEDYAQQIITALDYVGVLTIEFLDHHGELLTNTLIPGTHNTGYWTIEGAVTSQFENYLRAILNWPLGDTTARTHTVMYSLLDNMPNRTQLLNIRGAYLHDYGRTPHGGNILGHITLCKPTEGKQQQVEALIRQ